MIYLAAARILIPIYMIGLVGLILVAFSHLIFSNFDEDSEDSKLSLFGLRLFCAVFWPFILISAPGRRFMVAGVKGLFN